MQHLAFEDQDDSDDSLNRAVDVVLKDKQGKPMPNATPSVPDGSELDVSLYQPEGMLNYIENISLFILCLVII